MRERETERERERVLERERERERREIVLDRREKTIEIFAAILQRICKFSLYRETKL